MDHSHNHITLQISASPPTAQNCHFEDELSSLKAEREIFIMLSSCQLEPSHRHVATVVATVTHPSRAVTHARIIPAGHLDKGGGPSSHDV
jgi:hypothetical protein